MLPSHIKGLIIDMDGVIWKGDDPIGDLETIFSKIRGLGLKFVFATNNSTKTPQQYCERLSDFGVEIDLTQVVTSSEGAAHAASLVFPTGTKVFTIGEDGIRDALVAKGFKIVTLENAQDAELVVMGIDRNISFEKVAEATLLVRKGIPFYATNTDKTFPTPRGEIPGSGAWLSVITTSTGVEPVVAGKPFPYLMDLALERLGTSKEETLVVGDRLETDIAAGQGVGMAVALVLSGVSSKAQADAWSPAIDFIANNLSSLIS